MRRIVPVLGLQLSFTAMSKKKEAIAPLTKLSAAVVERPSDSDHVGIWLTAGQVLYRNFLVDLETGETYRVKNKLLTWHLFLLTGGMLSPFLPLF